MLKSPTFSCAAPSSGCSAAQRPDHLPETLKHKYPRADEWAWLEYARVSIFEWQIDRSQAQTLGVGYDAVKLDGLISLLGAFQIVIGDSDFSNGLWNADKIRNEIFVLGIPLALPHPAVTVLA